MVAGRFHLYWNVIMGNESFAAVSEMETVLLPFVRDNAPLTYGTQVNISDLQILRGDPMKNKGS